MSADITDKQHEIFTCIARSLENLRKMGSANITKGAVKTRLEQLNRYWEKFEKNHELLIHKSKELKDNVYFTEDLFSTTEEKFYSNKAEFLDLLDTMEAKQIVGPTGNQIGEQSALSANNASAFQSKTLPKIKLPRFGGRYQEWTSFRDLFLSLVGSNTSISAVEKLHYLKSSLFGDASKIIASIPVTGENYARAWEKLELRFENKRALVNAQLDTLFALQPLLRSSASELEELRSTVAEVLEALEALGGPVEHWDFILVHFLCRRLDPETHIAWELKLGNSLDPPTYAEFNSFLEGRVRALEFVDARLPAPRASSTPKPARPTSARVHTSSASSCPLCSASHYVALCAQYRSKTPEQRREIVTSKRLCYNCLGQHRSRDCRSTKRCMSCGENHHSSLHPRENPSPPASNLHQSTSSSGRPALRQTAQQSHAPTTSSAQNSSTETPPGTSATSCHALREKPCITPQVLLATAVVDIISPSGRSLAARALLDQGSELTFVCESLVQALQLPRRSSAIPLSGIGAQAHATTRGAVIIQLTHRSHPDVQVSVEAHILAKLTGKIPGSYVSSEQWNHLSSLELADPAFNIPGPIDILLGANIYGHLLTGEILSSGPSSPVAQRTVLGWVVSGPTSVQSDQPMPASRVFSCTADNALHESVKQFWAQEVVETPREGGMSAEDRRCEDHFRDTHTRDSTGRYIVRLPFCAVPAGAGESRAAAEGMLKRMHRRFERDPTFKELYTTFMDEYLQLDPMERVENPEENSYFLPHHGVLRESSLSTKLRVVFNGSQKSSSGDSLNDALHAGPKLQQDLIDVLMRWRLARVVFSSDVEKMYRQIVVHQDDRKYQCVLWSSSEDSAPATFRLSTVTYGLKSAPYLALRVVHQLADDEGDNFPMAASVLRNNMYVDDVLGGGGYG